MTSDEKIKGYLHDFTEKLYLNKKEVMYRIKTPLTIESFWPILLQHRKDRSITVPLKDQSNRNFWFVLTDNLKENLNIIEREAQLHFFEQIDEKFKNNVILNALIDEAFNSSVIEGAFSTRKRTKEMITKKIAPTNKSEQMIINNYKALDFILENLDKPLNEEMILLIYRKVVHNTLEKEDEVDKYRDDSVLVWDYNTQNVVYQAPSHLYVQSLMDELVGFINNDNDLLHPIIKACVIHFYFVYIHPFFDGNGRTARAISYMYLLQKGYNFFKFFSISTVVQEEKRKYYKAIKDTEDYDSDLTYFINFYAQMIINSITMILQDFDKEYKRQLVKKFLQFKRISLTRRQYKAILFSTKSNKRFSIAQYQKKFKVAYETARTDLNELYELNIFKKTKVGKKFYYEVHDTKELASNMKVEQKVGNLY